VPLRPGLCASVDHVVGDDDSAVAMRSGEVPVLATPRLIALCEEASVLAVKGELEPGETTVGMRIQVDHVAPTKVGSSVRADATLDKIEGRRLTFSVAVTDAAGLVAAGKVTRAVVVVDRFLEKAR
jgi:fluoroacetyl-CoA thioesterase